MCLIIDTRLMLIFLILFFFFLQYKNKARAVQALVKVVRKCLKQVLMENGGVDLAHKHMLKAFRRFDAGNTHKVLPRDFCLAVSVLIGNIHLLLSLFIMIPYHHPMTPYQHPIISYQHPIISYDRPMCSKEEERRK